MEKAKSFSDAIDSIEWYQCIHRSAGRRASKSKMEPTRVYQCSAGNLIEPTDDCDEAKDNQYFIREMKALRGRPDQRRYSPPATRKPSPEPVSDIRRVEQRLGTLEQGIQALTKQMSQLTATVSSLQTSIWKLSTLGDRQWTPRTRSPSPSEGCFKCGVAGHYSRDCPLRDKKAQSRFTEGCFQCGEKGHLQWECPQREKKVQFKEHPLNPSESGMQANS